MTTETTFCLSRLSLAIKVLAVMPMTFVATQANALNIYPGQNVVIDGASQDDRYVVKEATLTSNGARIVGVQAHDSTFTMNGGTVKNTAGKEVGVALYGSKGTLRDASVSSGGAEGMIVGTQSNRGSTVEVFDSTISGGTDGIVLSGSSTLALNNTQVSGEKAGLRAYDGQLTAQGGRIYGGTNGIVAYRLPTVDNPSVLNLNQTEVVGGTGAAILVDYPGGTRININDGTTLNGGNGNMLEIDHGGAADVNVFNSALSGNVQVGKDSALDLKMDAAFMNGDIVNNGGIANVGLNNGSVLTGRLDNVDKLSVNSDATWVMVDGQQALNALSMNGGNVKFGDSGAFYKLDVGNLSGTGGTFIMKADFGQMTGDFLNVTGTSSGDHQLLIASTGADPLSERLQMVHTADGVANFSLVGGRVDLGTYSYDLVSDNQNHDWYLDPDNKIISPSTNSVLALFNAAPSVLLGEMTTLRTRMGELRFNGGQSAGLWTRAYGNKYEVSNDKTGLGYNQSQRGFTLGADAPLEAGDGQWLIGVMAGHSQSDLDLNLGSKATINSYYMGGYATWLDSESGFYFDGVLKFNRLHNESNVAMSDGKKSKGNYTQNATGASAEFGRHITLDDGYFVEPYGQLSAVITQAQSYTLDNGLKAKGDRSSSVIGEVGVTAGNNIQLDSGGILQPYLKAAVSHEFDQSNKVFVNDNAFNNDLSGSRLKLGAGVAMSVSQELSVHADVERSVGKNIKQPLGINVGLRYAF
ncbi:autotransporter outer membrane beta-barrel domain-containing protein [Pseudomonas orientalis]|uniref:Pertactin family autotransporter n=2 Tax=Pseudomonas TaxID=286 RepID=A0AAE2U0S7_PSEFL|nr:MULTISPECIES: autotransporter outer membrane beta-barrel domain-containing protein [Pseudomonas fluorescens group]MBA1429326.1 autotransporter outer membrane beta-barrel domain-containing protein [Pseudomonas orientalis]MBD8268522.1 pertactin family autotransporter [Pseudomonas fluorescens]UOB25416.1 autotransporter outer membrane beta-barrel domain-containing protein [Pseudomonas orientalis]